MPNSCITLSSGKIIDLSKPYDLLMLTKEEFQELVMIVKNEAKEAA